MLIAKHLFASTTMAKLSLLILSTLKAALSLKLCHVTPILVLVGIIPSSTQDTTTTTSTIGATNTKPKKFAKFKR